MSEKRSFATFILDVIRNVIAPPEESKASSDAAPAEKKKVTLNDLSVEDLQKSKAMLDHEERKILLEIKELEKQKLVLAEQVGKGKVSDAEIRIISRKIKELLDEIDGMNRDLQMISKESRVINGFLRLKKRLERQKVSPFSQLVGDMDLAELSVFIDKATIEEKLNMEKFDSLLHDLGVGTSLAPEMSEDADVLAIEKVLREMAAAGDSEAMVQKLNEVHKNTSFDIDNEDA